MNKDAYQLVLSNMVGLQHEEELKEKILSRNGEDDKAMYAVCKRAAEAYESEANRMQKIVVRKAMKDRRERCEHKSKGTKEISRTVGA